MATNDKPFFAKKNPIHASFGILILADSCILIPFSLTDSWKDLVIPIQDRLRWNRPVQVLPLRQLSHHAVAWVIRRNSLIIFRIQFDSFNGHHLAGKQLQQSDGSSWTICIWYTESITPHPLNIRRGRPRIMAS